MHDLRELLPPLLQLTQEAGKLVLSYYRTDMGVERKDDRSPVTDADIAAQHFIIEGLEALAPAIPVVSEEQSHHHVSDAAERFWLVDPIDGTRSFLRGDDQFTVNIGLIEGDGPVLGVILIPATGELYWGMQGEGAWRRIGSGVPEKIATRIPASAGLDVLVSFSHLDPKTEDYLKDKPIRARHPSSSSLKFCRIAEGAGDLYPRFGPTMEWDTCAGQAIVEAAGGRVITPTGERFRYRKKGFRNGPFVVWGK